MVFSARAKRSEGKVGEQGKKRTLRLHGPDFIGRFMQHVLPAGLKRIRHYGVLANPNGKKLAQAKAALHMPAPNSKAQECAQNFMARVARVNIQQCPVCQQGRMGAVQTLAGAKRLPDPFESGARTANSRAPQGRDRERHRRLCEHLKPMVQLLNKQRQGRVRALGWLARLRRAHALRKTRWQQRNRTTRWPEKGLCRRPVKP